MPDVALRGRCLLPEEGITNAELTLEHGAIRRVRLLGDLAEENLPLLLPGIVDLHGDAFERQIMPRGGVFFDHALALAETDRQMTANGITTAFHGLTWSWEPGLRGGEAAESFVRALDEIRPRLACDTRVHLRFESYNIDALEGAARWIAQGRVHMLGFNDHLEMMLRHAANPGKLTGYLARTGMAEADFLDLMHTLRDRADEAAAGVRALASVAVDHGLPMASHDDETPEQRRFFHQLGCRLCEFPVNQATAEAAHALGDGVILGAPNVLRGKSHDNRLSARNAAHHGLCDILTSDYYYPSLLLAPFRLALEGIVDFARAWDMVSAAPARWAGLSDRGVIRPDARADLLVVDDTDAALPRVLRTLVAGRTIYAAGPVSPFAGPLPFPDDERRRPRHCTACSV